jgi:hypothetical protein
LTSPAGLGAKPVRSALACGAAISAQAQAMLRQHQAAESVRQQQQGHGNQIVS